MLELRKMDLTMTVYPQNKLRFSTYTRGKTKRNTTFRIDGSHVKKSLQARPIVEKDEKEPSTSHASQSTLTLSALLEMYMALCARFPKVTMTPLGSEVLPEVNCKNATSFSNREASSKH